MVSYAALGDSYASGDGAGSSKLLPHLDPTCGRFDGAYPVQLVNSPDLEISQFRNLACGGASTITVLREQAWFIGKSDIISVTVGGNEVDFFSLLNECVQQWRPFSTCEAEIAKSRTLVESTQFIARYGGMVQGLKRWAPGAFLLVTGYATFFNEHTEQCSTISFSKTNPETLLTKTLRRTFNNLVRHLNDVIRAACEANGVEYVDMENLFMGHRFCEEGVVEPVNRRQTWFFNLEYQGTDVFGSSQLPLVEPVGEFFNLTRTFHPTIDGHNAIARGIAEKILQRYNGKGSELKLSRTSSFNLQA